MSSIFLLVNNFHQTKLMSQTITACVQSWIFIIQPQMSCFCRQTTHKKNKKRTNEAQWRAWLAWALINISLSRSHMLQPAAVNTQQHKKWILIRSWK